MRLDKYNPYIKDIVLDHLIGPDNKFSCLELFDANEYNKSVFKISSILKVQDSYLVSFYMGALTDYIEVSKREYVKIFDYINSLIHQDERNDKISNVLE